MRANNKPAPATVSFCDAAEPFYWNKKDTDKTILQAKQHNAVGVDLKCKKFN